MGLTEYLDPTENLTRRGSAGAGAEGAVVADEAAVLDFAPVDVADFWDEVDEVEACFVGGAGGACCGCWDVEATAETMAADGRLVAGIWLRWDGPSAGGRRGAGKATARGS